MSILFRTAIIFQIICLFNNANAQKKDSIQNPTLGVHFLLNNHLPNALDPHKSSFKNSFSGLGISFAKGITKHLDWVAMTNGVFADSLLQDKPAFETKNLFFEASFTLRANLFPYGKRVNIFALGGVAAGHYKNYTSMFVPIGIGYQVKVFKGAFFSMQARYVIPLDSDFRKFTSLSAGITGVIGRTKRKSTTVTSTAKALIPVNRVDGDRDGIKDSLDLCPDLPGLEIFQGCPDRDNDGITDKDDHCPDLPGEKVYFGCPIPDTDQDGIFDDTDKCIDIPGVVEFKGCPVPDRDKDGVRDSEDSCPDVFGIKSIRGCPEISYAITKKIDSAARNIFFETDSHVLLMKSFAALDTVVSILRRNNLVILQINGHTDNVGTVVENQILSERRVESVRLYLMQNGIDERRLKAEGFGEKVPIVRNNSEENRAINRRVELKLYYAPLYD